MEIVATHIKILKISQLKKLRGNEAKEVIRPQIKRNQFGQISKAVTWQFSLYFVFRHVEMRQASNMKEWCQDVGSQHCVLPRQLVDKVVQI